MSDRQFKWARRRFGAVRQLAELLPFLAFVWLPLLCRELAKMERAVRLLDAYEDAAAIAGVPVELQKKYIGSEIDNGLGRLAAAQKLYDLISFTRLSARQSGIAGSLRA